LGAPYFAAHSFLKSGGGYSRLATPESITPFIANKGSEIVLLPQKETSSGSLAIDNKDFLLDLGNKMEMVVMGPGLSLEAETLALVRELAKDLEVPLLLDGDGITAICSDLQILKERRAETVLTPHLGEMAAMFGLGLDMKDAVLKGVFLHGFAGDLAAEEKGADGMTAQDILDHLPPALKEDREGLRVDFVDRYKGVRII